MGLIGFQTPLKIMQDCQLSIQNSAFLPTTTTNHHKNMSRIKKEGEWVVESIHSFPQKVVCYSEGQNLSNVF